MMYMIIDKVIFLMWTYIFLKNGWLQFCKKVFTIRIFDVGQIYPKLWIYLAKIKINIFHKIIIKKKWYHGLLGAKINKRVLHWANSHVKLKILIVCMQPNTNLLKTNFNIKIISSWFGGLEWSCVLNMTGKQCISTNWASKWIGGIWNIV